jgi:hypothetical protein
VRSALNRAQKGLKVTPDSADNQRFYIEHGITWAFRGDAFSIVGLTPTPTGVLTNFGALHG